MTAAPAAAVEVVVAADEVDLASGLLWASGVTAVAEHPEPDGEVRLRADVPDGGVSVVEAALGGRWPVVEVDVADDGLDTWRDHAEVVTVGPHLVVRPPWVPLGDVLPGAVVLEIDPGRSFGHGAHPTTRLCLAAIEERVDAHPSAAVLDVGCGSGVLAVAAARLGAGRVVAVDIDPAAVDATRANAAANGVADRIEVVTVAPGRLDARPPVLARWHRGDAMPPRENGSPGDERFDVVVANIGAQALVALASALQDRLAEGGTLVLSGLLDPPPAEVAPTFAPLEVTEVRRLDGWVALLLAPKPERPAVAQG